VTAIRKADTDGNPSTEPDAAWLPLRPTPPLPDYPSTHSVLGAAASAVMARLFGDQIAFTMTSGPPFAGITRSFSSLSQAARENADSRVWGGIHFRSACEGGLALGAEIGRRAAGQHLLPYRP
jgi:PAP2 superfamily